MIVGWLVVCVFFVRVFVGACACLFVCLVGWLFVVFFVCSLLLLLLVKMFA